MVTRKRYDNRFKAQVVLEALKNQRTMAEIASEYGVHANQITKWKRRVLDELPSIFSNRRERDQQDNEALQAELYRQIGQLKVELDRLKKKLDLSLEERRLLIEPKHPEIPIYRQCELVDLARASYYYEPKGETQYNLLLMRLLDEQYTTTPFYGSPKMTQWLRSQGHMVNHKRVERLMGIMGLQAIYPKPKLSRKGDNTRKYPYLLEGLDIQEPDKVWCSDITYIRLRRGFVYLVVIMDWFSRYVLSWEVSNSLDTFFCIAALEKALSKRKPEIFNSDQGSQFTSQVFTERLENSGIRISWDGRGRLWDNIFVERLWRSVKYEEVYLNDCENITEAIQGLGNYFGFYNTEKFHQSLGYRTPLQVYMDRN